MEAKEFDKLIEKYLNDELGDDEKGKVEDWLQHITNDHAADLLAVAEQEERGKRIFTALDHQIRHGKPKIPLIKRLQPVLTIAASLLIICSLIFVFRTRLKQVFNIDQIGYATNSGKHITKTILSDGSIVWLKGNSKLIYPLRFLGASRNVDLEGEALFEIAKDPAHPFVIKCAGLNTKVLGTSFNIKHTSKKIEVNVLTGKVFLSSGDSVALTLHPFQKAVYSELKRTIVKEKDPIREVDALIKGTEYNMSFNDARVGDVIHRIEKKFEINIAIKEPGLMSSRITADFTDQSLLNTMTMMSEALNLNFQIDDGSVILTEKTE